MGQASRYWGDDRALLDDAEARRRLLEAAGRCIVGRGNTQIRMNEVAEQAGVVRSTVYRYFPTRDHLLLALLMERIESALDALVRGLSDPADARRSIVEIVLVPVGSVDGDAMNEALLSTESAAFTAATTMGSDQIVDALDQHFGALLERWRDSGQLYADLDRRELLRWIHTAQLFLLSPPWRNRPAHDKREFVERLIVRAIVPPEPRQVANT